MVTLLKIILKTNLIQVTSLKEFQIIKFYMLQFHVILPEV